MRIFLVIFLFLVTQISAQELSLRKGIVMDSLRVSDTLQETFALYLPTSFENEDRPLPVLFVFDSEGRGKTVAQLFKPAAEEQGYIIASSNNINPEKTFKENLITAANLMNGVFNKIPIDSEYISVAGFSEGARVASSMPLVFGGIHGIIAVGDHQVRLDLLEQTGKFAFVGITGNRDFSSYNVRTAAEQLDYNDFPAAAFSFDGGHEWPSPQTIAMGVGFLTLQAMKNEKRPKDPELISSLYDQQFKRVNQLLNESQFFQAYELLNSMESTYRGLIDISEIRAKLKEVRRSDMFTQQKEEISQAYDKEVRLGNDFVYYLNEDIETANFENLGWWNYQKLQLEEMTRSDSKVEANLGHRLLRMVDELLEAKRKELKKDEDASLPVRLLANMMQTIFDPTDFEAYKQVVSLSAKDRDYSTALFYLEEMLKHGYDEMDDLYELDGTLALRMTPEYNWLIKKYLGSSKYYDIPEE